MMVFSVDLGICFDSWAVGMVVVIQIYIYISG